MKKCPECGGQIEYQSVMLGKKKTPKGGPPDYLIHIETWVRSCPKEEE